MPRTLPEKEQSAANSELANQLACIARLLMILHADLLKVKDDLSILEKRVAKSARIGVKQHLH